MAVVGGIVICSGSYIENIGSKVTVFGIKFTAYGNEVNVAKITLSAIGRIMEKH